MRKPNRNLQYRDLSRKLSIVGSFDPSQTAGKNQEISMGPAVQENKKNNETDPVYRIYETYKRATAGKRDTLFERVFRNHQDCYSGLAVNGYIDFFIANVPVGQRLVIQQYLFFAEVDNRPANAFPVLAEPNEFFERAHFQILVNGISPMMSYYTSWSFPLLLMAVQYDALPVLSKDINADSNPNSPGISLIVKGGSVVVFRFTRTSALALWRPMMSVGCRIRGFFGPEFTDGMEEK
jgi:hypothetical protein